MADETPAVVPMTEAPKSGKSIIATRLPVTKYKVGDLTVTNEGTELSAADAKKVLDASIRDNVRLVIKKEASA